MSSCRCCSVRRGNSPEEQLELLSCKNLRRWLEEKFPSEQPCTRARPQICLCELCVSLSCKTKAIEKQYAPCCHQAILITCICVHTEKFFSVELAFEVSLTGLSMIKYFQTQDQSHSDTTRLYYIYIYIWRDMVKNSKVKKTSIYKQVIYYFPSKWKIKYLIIFSYKFLFLKCFLKFLTKILVKKPSNTLFSIKMENNIFKSLYTEIFVSTCIY